MKKTLPILTLMAFFMLLTAGNVSGQDYHFSESFASNATPDGWQVKDVSYSSSSTNAANQVDPSAEYCAKMKTNNTDSWIQLPMVNDAVSLSFWCKVKDPAENPVVIIQSSTDGTNWTDVISSATGITGLDMSNSTDFQDVTIPLNIDGAVFIRIYVSADGGSAATGMFTVDDIRLEKPAPTDDDARLAAIYVGGDLIDGFHPNTTSYAVKGVMPDDDITVTAAANNENAGVAITQVTDLEGTEAERTATVVVTSVDGNNSFTATILFTASQIRYHIQEGFSSGSLPDGWSSNDNISIGDWSKIPNLVFTDQRYGIKLKVEDPVESWVQLPGMEGVKELSFSVFFRDEAGNLNAKVQISTDGENWSDFASPIPGLDMTNTVDFQLVTVPVDLDGPVFLRVVAFTTDGAGAASSGVYVDDFQVQKLPAAADDATLDAIFIGDNEMHHFDKNVTEYDTTVSRAMDYSVIAVANNPNATVEVTQVSDIQGSEAERTATIVVTSEDGTATATTTVVFTQTDYWYKTGFPVGQGLEGWDRHRVYQDNTPNYPSSDKYPGVANIKFTGGHETGGDDPTHGHLVSPKLPNLDTLSFWASAEVVYPEHELNVYIKTSDNDSTLVKSITGDALTYEWQEVVVPIVSEDSVQIRIEGICDINNESDSRIWMDDFLLTYYEPPVIGADDATLKGLYVGGEMVEDFSSDVTSYAMDVTPIMDITVTAEASNENATVDITQASDIDGTEEERTATIVVTSEDESTTSTTTILFTNLTAVERYQFPEVVLYPNPAKEMLNIQVTDNAYQRLEIFDITGQKVRNTILTSNFKVINIEDLSEGLYIISFTGEAGSHSAKFIKE